MPFPAPQAPAKFLATSNATQSLTPHLLQFQAKQARREAQKAAKQDPLLKKQIQDLLKKGETAKAYQKAKMLLSKQALAQQMDQMADMAELSVAQIQANNSMNRMTHMMGQSSRTMNAAQRNMNPERVRVVVLFPLIPLPLYCHIALLAS